MSKVDILGKAVSFNPETNSLYFKLDFVDAELLKEIETLLQHSYPIKISFKPIKPFRSKTYKQQCQFWVDFGKVLKAQEIVKTEEVTETLYRHIRETIFPCRQIIIGYGENNDPIYDYYVPNMKDLSMEEMKNVIVTFREKYSYLQIDWEKKEF